ncbi:MAG: hypothetical protein ACTSP3_01235 [Candidatus Heimdallarchaeaceae archaeon]
MKECQIRKERKYGFGTYKGLVTFIIAYLTLAILFLGTFSQPVIDIFGRALLPIHLDDSYKVSRIIMLYHSLAMPFLAAVVFLVLDTCNVRPKFKAHIKWPILVGSILTSTMGLTFAYLSPWNMIVHAFFIFGLSLVFYSGVVLLIAVFPTKNFPGEETNRNGPAIKSFNLEQLNLALVALCLLITASLGAYVGANYGNTGAIAPDFNSILAESMLRSEHDLYTRMIIAHLHTMLALIDAAVLLIVLHNTKVSKTWNLVSHILITPGIIITSVGAWLVVPGLENAHVIINVGAAFLLAAALILVVFGFKETSKSVLGEKYETASFLSRFGAIFKDSVKFGLYWLFIWVNFVVTAPGIYSAIKLDEIRSQPFDQEYSFAVGHWHVLAVLTAMMVLLFFIDQINIKGILRTITGWLVTVGGLAGFGAAIYFMMVDNSSSIAMIVTDLGLTLLFSAIGIFCVYQLVKIIQGKTRTEENS